MALSRPPTPRPCHANTSSYVQQRWLAYSQNERHRRHSCRHIPIFSSGTRHPAGGGEFLRFHFKHRFLIFFSIFLQNIFLSTKFLDDLFCLFTLYMLCRVFLNFGACTVAIRLKGGEISIFPSFPQLYLRWRGGKTLQSNSMAKPRPASYLPVCVSLPVSMSVSVYGSACLCMPVSMSASVCSNTLCRWRGLSTV